jgi:hypothetical protein
LATVRHALQVIVRWATARHDLPVTDRTVIALPAPQVTAHTVIVLPAQQVIVPQATDNHLAIDRTRRALRVNGHR